MRNTQHDYLTKILPHWTCTGVRRKCNTGLVLEWRLLNLGIFN